MENISIELNYPFLYYGFYMRNIIVSTRAGFIYMEGQGKDSVLAPLQYVAPLMGMFVESPNDLAFVQFGFNGKYIYLVNLLIIRFLNLHFRNCCGGRMEQYDP